MSIKQKYFDYLRETAKIVDPYVEEFFKIHFFKTLLPMPDLGQSLISRYRLGKPQLRPSIVRLAFELAGGQNLKRAVPACAAVEVKDTAYYCVDDVIDKGVEPQLMLTGLGLHAVSYRMIRDINGFVSQENFVKILDEMFLLDIDTLQGANIDINMHETDEQCYLLKIKGYNFWDHAMRIGAILGGGSTEQVSLLGEIGRSIGMAHIIANDCWDFAKDLEDFRQRKSTLPILWALKNTSDRDHNSLETLFGKNELSHEEIETVRRIIVQSSAIEKGKKEVNLLCKEATDLLERQFPPSSARELLKFSTTYAKKNKYIDLLKQYEKLVAISS